MAVVIEKLLERDMRSFETFKEFGSYEVGNMTVENPTCFNGMVRVKKYKVTIEEIAEPIEVIHKRLKQMWCNIDNHHHIEPLRREAKKYGLSLSHLR